MNSFLLQRVPPGDKRRCLDIERVVHALEELPESTAYRVSVEETKSTRTLSQNAMLWALYGDILKRGGETLTGFDPEDLHRLFLGEHYGWDRIEALGKVRIKPLKRSSTMSKLEFSEHLDFIHRYMAQKGIVL